MSTFQPPPTYAEVVLVDPENKKPPRFNPVWLKWFLDLSQNLGAAGGGSVSSVSGVAANGFTWSIANSTTTPAITLGQSDVAGTTYTPTLFNTTNIAASTAYQCQYIRTKSTCLVSGLVDVDPTAAGQVQLGLTLPVASNLGAVEDLAGTAFCPVVAGQGAALYADAANNRALMEWIAVDVANRAMYFIFAYQII